jgi:Icc-related predicted phosphoesterase
MKILAIGDFHGEFPKKFEKIIKKEKIGLVVSLGDYVPFHYRDLWFKHCYGREISLGDVIGKRKYRALVMKDLKMAEKALKKMNNLHIPIYTILGNVDYPRADDIRDIKKYYGNKKLDLEWRQPELFIKRLEKYKNIRRFDYGALRFGEYVFIGMRGHSFPGSVKSKAYKRNRKKLDKLFKKFKKENKKGKVIFVSHNIAHNTKLDKLSLKAIKFALKHAGKKFRKKVKERKRHYGSKLARRIIQAYDPILHIGGHIHESWGKQKLGRTTLINPGAAHHGKAVIIELKDGRLKKVKFLK